MTVEVSRVYVPRVGSFVVNVKLGTDGPPRRTTEHDIAAAFQQVPNVESARPALKGHSIWEIWVYENFSDAGREKLRQVAEGIVARERA